MRPKVYVKVVLPPLDQQSDNIARVTHFWVQTCERRISFWPLLDVKISLVIIKLITCGRLMF